MSNNAFEHAFARTTFPAPKTPRPPNARRRPRVIVTLPGRYMTPDGREHACATLDLSATGMLLKGNVKPAREARVIAYIRDLGRVEGEVVRFIADGFALSFLSSPTKEQRLANRIDWIFRNGRAGVDRPVLPRLEFEGALVAALTGDADPLILELLDISATGAAFRTDARLRIGEKVKIGNQTGYVVRLFDGGAAVRFA